MLLYSIGIALYRIATRIAALLGNEKATKRLAGIDQLWQKDVQQIPQHAYWIHVASLGEYEQIKTIVKLIKEKSNSPVVVSFFSSSGYENVQDPMIDYKFYLPFDQKGSMRRLVHTLKPRALFLSKYEIWPVQIDCLAQKNIPILLFSGYFRKEKIYFRSYAGILRKAIAKMEKIFVQDTQSLEALSRIFPLEKIAISGDLRMENIQATDPKETLSEDVLDFVKNRKVLIAGSIYPEDMEMLLSYWDPLDSKLILAPHPMDQRSLEDIESYISNEDYTRISQSENREDKDILVLDRVGYLKQCYALGDYCYVGGGFQGGVHNVLEPAIYGLPTAVGPKNEGFPEIETFRELGSLEIIEHRHDFVPVMTDLAQKKKEELLAGNQREFVEQRKRSRSVYDFLMKRFFMVS